jgi:mono/diheme cytochrome c family protein
LVLKRSLLAGFATACGLMIFAGCRSSRSSSEPVVAPVATNTPAIARPELAPAEPVKTPTPLSSFDTVATNILVWDAKMKKDNPKPGEEKVDFTFTLTNVSSTELVIYATETTCECTIAKLPSNPWVIPAGGSGNILVTLNLHGKQGRISKGITVLTSQGNSLLTVEAMAPPSGAGMGDRTMNQAAALADRQAVFRGECARCHVEPAKGKMGPDLYVAACAICHDSPHRASMVPDLRAGKGLMDLNYWKDWIANGRERTMMPAFAQVHGGPLTDAQIDSLAKYLVQTLPGPASPRK